MKKLLSVLVLSLALGTAAFAQPKSFGLRVGPGLEISYQHTVNHKQFVEVDAGVLGISEYPGFRISAAYDFNILNFRLLRGQFNMFLGPGLSVGMYDKSLFTAGIMVQYGVSYDFPNAPLSLAVDTCPSLWLNSEGVTMRFKSLIPMLSLRWKF